MTQRYVATMRVTFHAEDETEAVVEADHLAQAVENMLEEGDTLDLTQVIAMDLTRALEPQELVERMRFMAKALVATRVRECYDLGSWLWRTAWVLEHRAEDSFDAGGYDHGEFVSIAGAILKRERSPND